MESTRHAIGEKDQQSSCLRASTWKLEQVPEKQNPATIADSFIELSQGLEHDPTEKSDAIGKDSFDEPCADAQPCLADEWQLASGFTDPEHADGCHLSVDAMRADTQETSMTRPCVTVLTSFLDDPLGQLSDLKLKQEKILPH